MKLRYTLLSLNIAERHFGMKEFFLFKGKEKSCYNMDSACGQRNKTEREGEKERNSSAAVISLTEKVARASYRGRH